MTNQNLNIKYVPTNDLKPAKYNPRKWDNDALNQLKESLKRFDVLDPLIVNSAPDRKNIVIGGHMRLKAAKEMGKTLIPVVYVNIPEIDMEKELNVRLNKNTGEWDWTKLADFDQGILTDIGFKSEELDDIFGFGDTPEQFDLEKELQKLDINTITIKKGDVYKLGDSRMMCGDSTIEEDVIKL